MMRILVSFLVSVFFGTVSAAELIPHVSCFSTNVSVVIIWGDDYCKDNGRALECHARVKVKGKALRALSPLLVLKADLPQTQNTSLMLTSRDPKMKLMFAFSGMSTDTHGRKFTGEVHVEYKDINITEKMECGDY